MKGLAIKATLFLAILAAPAQAGEHFLSFRKDLGIGHQSPFGQWLSIELSETPPAGLVPEEPEPGREIYYGILPLGNRPLVLEITPRDAEEPDFLRLDVNGDGAIAEDEQFIFGNQAESRYYARFLCVPVLLRQGPDVDEQLLQLSYSTNGGVVVLNYKNQSHWRGHAEFGAKKYDVALHDTNGDGRYSVVPGEMDSFCVDLNGDGSFSPELASGETSAVGNYVLVDGKYWGLEFAPDGSSIKISEPIVTLGSVLPDEPDVTLMIEGASGRFTLARESAAQSFWAPVGEYQLVAAEVRKDDKDGKPWILSSRGNAAGSESELLTVSVEAPVPVKLGPPLVASVNRSGFFFTPQIRGEDGFEYTILKGKNRALPPAPSLDIKAKEGDFARRFSFSYG